MRMRRLAKVFAFLFWAVACGWPGKCKVGDNESCGAEAFCYAGKNPKPGDMGVCTFAGELVIDSFSPLEAAQGAILLIRGKGFGLNPSENSVTLNGVLVETLFASASELRIQVPKNMRCAGPIEVRTGERTATSAESFIYLPTATVSTFAGSGKNVSEDGMGTAAGFRFPNTLALDAKGELYVTETDNNAVRKIVTESREVSTFAGGGPSTFADGVGTAARFNRPTGIAMDAQGNLYVADWENHRIRKIVLE